MGTLRQVISRGTYSCPAALSLSAARPAPRKSAPPTSAGGRSLRKRSAGGKCPLLPTRYSSGRLWPRPLGTLASTFLRLLARKVNHICRNDGAHLSISSSKYSIEDRPTEVGQVCGDEFDVSDAEIARIQRNLRQTLLKLNLCRNCGNGLKLHRQNTMSLLV